MQSLMIYMFIYCVQDKERGSLNLPETPGHQDAGIKRRKNRNAACIYAVVNKGENVHAQSHPVMCYRRQRCIYTA